MGSATRAASSGASVGNVPCSSCSSRRTRSTCWQSRRPVSVKAARLVAHDQRAADAFFQQPDALREMARRRRDMQCAGSAIEAAFSNDGSQRRQAE